MATNDNDLARLMQELSLASRRNGSNSLNPVPPKYPALRPTLGDVGMLTGQQPDLSGIIGQTPPKLPTSGQPSGPVYPKLPTSGQPSGPVYPRLPTSGQPSGPTYPRLPTSGQPSVYGGSKPNNFDPQEITDKFRFWGSGGGSPELAAPAPVDPLAALAEQLAGQVGAYPGAVPINMPERVRFDRWQRDQDLSGIFDPIQAEYAPVLDTLYNNLQGSMGNIRQSLDQGWQDTRGNLESQWGGVNEDQQAAFAERDAELKQLATQLGVPESAMMTDPSLERWGRENERLKQLNQTLQTNQMGNLDTLAQSQSAGLGAYGPALEAARGQSLGEMAMTLAGQKGQLGSDLLNLESQHETAMSQGEMALYQQMFDAAMQNSEREYGRQVKGWEMRSNAALEAAKAQKEAEDKRASDEQLTEFMKQMTQTGGEETTSMNTPQWNQFMSELNPEELNALYRLAGRETSDKSLRTAGMEAYEGYGPWVQDELTRLGGTQAPKGILSKFAQPALNLGRIVKSKKAKSRAAEGAVGRRLVAAGPDLFGGLGAPSTTYTSGSSGRTQSTLKS